MSAQGLFIPTYGKQTERTPGRPKTRSRPISKSGSTKPTFKNKRSLMPSMVFNGNIEYIQTFEAAEKAAKALEAARPEVLGFDIEWEVSFVPGQAPRPTATLQLCVPENPTQTDTATAEAPQNPVPTPSSNCHDNADSRASSGQEHGDQDRRHDQGQRYHQQLRPSSSVWGTAYIFHLCHMRRRPPALEEVAQASPSPQAQPGDRIAPCTASSSAGQENHHGSPDVVTTETGAYLPDTLVRVLSDPGIMLAGVGVGGDVSRLEREYEQLRVGGVNGVVDLSALAKRKVLPDRRRRGMWSLADLCSELLHLELRKPSSLRTGKWEKRPLHVDQLFYAAADAYAGVRLWQVLRDMPDLVLQQSDANGLRDDNDAPSDTDSSIMASASSAGDPGGSLAAAAAAEGVNVAACGDVENRAPASGSSRVAPRLPLAKLETYRLWHEDGLSVEAVAQVRRNKTSTVQGYLSGAAFNDGVEVGVEIFVASKKPLGTRNCILHTDCAWSALVAKLDQPLHRHHLFISTGSVYADCIEAGLPYDWERLGIDPSKEKQILTGLLAATEGGKPVAKDSTQQETKQTKPVTNDEQKAAPMPAVSGKASLLSGAARASSSSRFEKDALPGAMLAAKNASKVVANVSPTASSSSNSSSNIGVTSNAGTEAEAEVVEQSASGNDAARADSDVERLAASERHGSLSGPTGNARGVTVVAASITGRWEGVRLKEAKALAPDSEYWEIRMVLARLKSGWLGYQR